jgi:hypothetical protein
MKIIFFIKLFHSDNKQAWKYNDEKFPKESSITILAGSLQLDRTYQFMVHMQNRRNSSVIATGSVLVKTEDSDRPMIVVG